MLFWEVERDLLCKVLYLCAKNNSLFDGIVNFHEKCRMHLTKRLSCYIIYYGLFTGPLQRGEVKEVIIMWKEGLE